MPSHRPRWRVAEIAAARPLPASRLLAHMIAPFSQDELSPPMRGRRRRRPVALAVTAPLLLLAALGACDEQLVTAGTCPELCPDQQVTVHQAVLQPVVFDTTVTGFPVRGQEPQLLVASGEMVDVRAIYRFDDLPTAYDTPSGDTASIEQVLDPFLRVLINRPISRIPAAGATLVAYDVQAAGADTAVAELAPLFSPARELGSLFVSAQPSADSITVDTLRVPLAPEVVLAAIRADGRLRIGLRSEGEGATRLRLTHGAEVEFRAVADTAVAPVVIAIASDTPEDEPFVRSDLASFPLVVQGTPELTEAVLQVGGLPARRSMLRFAIPPGILDSSTVIGATLVLTQRPLPGYPATDSAVLRPLPVTAAPEVTDLRRLFQLAANPTQSGIEIALVPSVALAPGDSGQVELSLANLMNLWSVRAGIPLQPLLVLAVDAAGATPLELAFYSSEASPSLRPSLRLSYVRRVNFALP